MPAWTKTGKLKGPKGHQGGPGGSTSSFAYTLGSATIEPPTGDQVVVNNANQTQATKIWVRYVTTDNHDVANVLRMVKTGMQVYYQASTDSTKWQSYNVIS